MVAALAQTALPHSVLPCPGLLFAPVREVFGRHRNCLPAHLSRIPSKAESEEERQEWGAVVKVIFSPGDEPQCRYVPVSESRSKIKVKDAKPFYGKWEKKHSEKGKSNYLVSPSVTNHLHELMWKICF